MKLLSPAEVPESCTVSPVTAIAGCEFHVNAPQLPERSVIKIFSSSEYPPDTCASRSVALLITEPAGISSLMLSKLKKQLLTFELEYRPQSHEPVLD